MKFLITLKLCYKKLIMNLIFIFKYKERNQEMQHKTNSSRRKKEKYQNVNVWKD